MSCASGLFAVAALANNTNVPTSPKTPFGGRSCSWQECKSGREGEADEQFEAMDVAIGMKRGKGWITLSPLPKQPEPKHLPRIKTEVLRRWGVIGLLDMGSP